MNKKSITRPLLMVVMGFLVMIFFLISFVILYIIANLVHSSFGWYEISPTLIFIVALLCSLPITIPFWGDRLTKVKLFEFEVALSESTTSISQVLPNELKDIGRLQLGSSLAPDIIKQVRYALESTAREELVEVNLGNGQNWLATRLYLLAALAEGFTDIKRIVILENREGKERCFLGFVPPQTIRRALARRYPIIERAYVQAHQQYITTASKDVIDPIEEIESTVQNFGSALQLQSSGDEAELRHAGIREWVDGELLDNILNLHPQIQSVAWSGEPANPLIIYQILNCNGPFVALVHNQKLKRVVDRYELAIRISKTGLERQLG